MHQDGSTSWNSGDKTRELWKVHSLPVISNSFIHPQASIKLLLCMGYYSKGFGGILDVQDLDSPLQELKE